jgi:hypothetical protein
MNLKGEFVVRIGDELCTYANTDSIPEHYDNLIKFAPEAPSGPHTEEEHGELTEYMNIFKSLMAREAKGKFTNF